MTYNNDDFLDNLKDVLRKKGEELGENCASTFEEAKQKLDDFIEKSGGISGLTETALERATGLAGTVVNVISDKATELGKGFAEYLEEVQSSLEECGGWDGLFDSALNGEEKICETVTFEECVLWVKQNLQKELHGGAILSKMENEPSDEPDYKKLTLKVCFMDKDENPLPDETSKYLLIRCNSLDNGLTAIFEDKNTIILK